MLPRHKKMRPGIKALNFLVFIKLFVGLTGHFSSYILLTRRNKNFHRKLFELKKSLYLKLQHNPTRMSVGKLKKKQRFLFDKDLY